MKIGIITFWESTDNYGQVLQAYALQQALQSMGHEPFQIRYSIKASQAAENSSSFLKKIMKLLLIYPLIKSIKRRRVLREDTAYHLMIEKKNEMRRFGEFRSKYIVQGDVVYNSIEEIRTNPPSADCYITGSDQVWTMLLNNEGNAAYFLDFGNKNTKRISYAPSFGRASYPQKLLPRLRELLNHFDAISVREQEGVNICESIGVKAEHVLDPTLLLAKTEYFNKLNFNDEEKDNSLFVYSINVRTPEDLYWSKLKQYAVDNGLKIIVTTSSGNFPGREIYEDVEYFYATVEEWIRSINKAQLVATSSFHGVVFCLLMHTNFIFYPLKGKETKSNGRVQSLLQSLNLEDKICNCESDVNNCILINPVWERVDDLLIHKRKESLEFLSKI